MTIRRLTLGLACLLTGLATTFAQTTPPSTSAPTSASTSAPAAFAPATNKVKFYGITDEATRIVYIVDHSGSLLDNFDFLRAELKRSVDHLVPLQYFNVVLFSEEARTLLPSGQLARATAEAKKEFIAKFDKCLAQGSNCDIMDPLQKAFEEAFKCKPQVIYFLTDGNFDPKLVQVVDALNKDKKVRINTLAFVNGEPSYEEQLQKIAKDNGGKYLFVAEKDLK